MSHLPVPVDTIDTTDYFLAAARGHLLERWFHSARLRLVRATVPLDGRRVLDVGAGTGAVALPLARDGVDVCAVESSVDNLATLQQHGRELGIELPAVQADGRALPFADATWDVVLLVSVVHLLPHPGPLLREAERVCRPGGNVVVAGPWHLHPKANPTVKRLLGGGRGGLTARPVTPDTLRRSMLRSRLVDDRLTLAAGYRCMVWERIMQSAQEPSP